MFKEMQKMRLACEEATSGVSFIKEPLLKRGTRSRSAICNIKSVSAEKKPHKRIRPLTSLVWDLHSQIGPFRTNDVNGLSFFVKRQFRFADCDVFTTRTMKLILLDNNQVFV